MLGAILFGSLACLLRPASAGAQMAGTEQTSVAITDRNVSVFVVQPIRMAPQQPFFTADESRDLKAAVAQIACLASNDPQREKIIETLLADNGAKMSDRASDLISWYRSQTGKCVAPVDPGQVTAKVYEFDPRLAGIRPERVGDEAFERHPSAVLKVQQHLTPEVLKRIANDSLRKLERAANCTNLPDWVKQRLVSDFRAGNFTVQDLWRYPVLNYRADCRPQNFAVREYHANHPQGSLRALVDVIDDGQHLPVIAGSIVTCFNWGAPVQGVQLQAAAAPPPPKPFQPRLVAPPIVRVRKLWKFYKRPANLPAARINLTLVAPDTTRDTTVMADTAVKLDIGPTLTFAGLDTGTVLRVRPGLYKVTEDAMPGYETEYGNTCSSLRVAFGGTYGCEVTNEQQHRRRWCFRNIGNGLVCLLPLAAVPCLVHLAAEKGYGLSMHTPCGQSKTPKENGNGGPWQDRSTPFASLLSIGPVNIGLSSPSGSFDRKRRRN